MTRKTKMTPAKRRAALVAALRGDLPDGFKWNFGNILATTNCESVGCALGLAQTIGIIENAYADAENAKKFGMRMNEFHRVFYGVERDGGTYYLKNYRDAVFPDGITQQMVANELEKIG